MSRDQVWLRGVECRCRIGVPAAERRRPQLLRVDVGIETDVSRAAAADDFRHAVDYWAVEKQVRAEAESGERRLVETLAERLAAVVLARQPLAAAVTIRVHKRPAVMPRVKEVVVELRRERRTGKR